MYGEVFSLHLEPLHNSVFFFLWASDWRCRVLHGHKNQVLKNSIDFNVLDYGNFTDGGLGSYRNSLLLSFGVVSRREYPDSPERPLHYFIICQLLSV